MKTNVTGSEEKSLGIKWLLQKML